MSTTMISPVARALARAAEENPTRAIASASVVHPMVEGPAILVVSWSNPIGLAPQASDAPGVSIMAWERPDDTVMPLPPMAEAGRQIIAAAWAWGAWDIQRTCIGPGYTGSLPPSWEVIGDSLRMQGYATWTCRPMMAGPALRAKVHGKSDRTLHPITLARHDAPPVLSVPPMRPGTQHVIRLGIDPKAKATTGRPELRATGKQRAYIVVLRRGTDEQGAPLPASLTRSEASAMIDRLIAKRTEG